MTTSFRGNSQDPLMILKPKFLKSIALLKSLPIAVFLGLFTSKNESISVKILLYVSDFFS